MQVKSVPDFVPGMRYYRSEADIRKLHHGEPYGNLPNVIQIIICLFDPIGEGRCIYDYEMREKNSNTPLKDNGQRMIFLNCKGFRKRDCRRTVRFREISAGRRGFRKSG